MVIPLAGGEPLCVEDGPGAPGTRVPPARVPADGGSVGGADGSRAGVEVGCEAGLAVYLTLAIQDYSVRGLIPTDRNHLYYNCKLYQDIQNYLFKSILEGCCPACSKFVAYLVADAVVEVDGPLANPAREAALVIHAVAHSHLLGLENLRGG